MSLTGSHIFGVVRHAERADAAFAVALNGAPRWTTTSDAQTWPFDPPITDDGKHLAGEAGQKIQAFAEECGTKVDVIVCSPYARCIQTASAICSKLRPACRILIDHSFGEIYGPAIMGPAEPHFVVRPIEQSLTQATRRKQLIGGAKKIVGAWPKWPETARSARQRFANRFLMYLRRSMASTRNFIIVTHADCVGAALSVMPSHVDASVEKIDYCGMFLARRGTGENLIIGRLMRIMTVTPEDDGEGHLSEQEAAMLEEGKAADADPDRAEELPDHTWQVRTSGMKIHRLEAGQVDSVAQFDKRAKSLEKSSLMSQEKIRFLLGALTEAPLGDNLQEIMGTSNAHMSNSTILFNKSGDASQSHSSGSVPNSSKVGGGFSANLSVIKTPSNGHQEAVPSVGPGGNDAANKEKASKSSRLSVCREILGKPDKPTDQAAGEVNRGPVLNTTMNSLMQRRANAGVASLKLSL